MDGGKPREAEGPSAALKWAQKFSYKPEAAKHEWQRLCPARCDHRERHHWACERLPCGPPEMGRSAGSGLAAVAKPRE